MCSLLFEYMKVFYFILRISSVTILGYRHSMKHLLLKCRFALSSLKGACEGFSEWALSPAFLPLPFDNYIILNCFKLPSHENVDNHLNLFFFLEIITGKIIYMYLFYMKLIQLFRCLLNINILFIKHVGNSTLESCFQRVFCLRFVQ